MATFGQLGRGARSATAEIINCCNLLTREEVKAIFTPLDETDLQNAVKRAVRKADLTKHASCHTFRHPLARKRGRDRFIGCENK